MTLLIALCALSGVQDAREERGRFRLTCFGKEAGTEEYRLEDFEDGHVVLFSKARWSVDVLGEKRDFQVDAVLTMEKTFAPIRYAGFHRSGKQEDLVKVEWQKGLALPDKKKPVRTAAPFVLDHNAVSQLLPILRRLDGRRKVLVFRPSTSGDAELVVADRGEAVLRGPDSEVRVRERLLTLGPMLLTVHTDEKGRLLRAWNALQETLAELEGFEGWTPAPLAKRPETVEEQEVSFRSGRVQLSGAVTKPKDAKGCPAIVLLGAAGAHDRDGNRTVDGPAPGAEAGPADFLRQIADALTAAGYLVLRFGDRDLGRATLEDLAADARAAVDFLRARPDVGSVSIAGHDEGGLVATLVASRDASIKSVALLAAPGKTLDLMLLEAAERDLRAQGTAEAVLSAMLDKERRTFESIRRSTGEFLDIDERRTFVGWMRDRFRHDPAAALRKVTAPVVILQGARDPLAHADLLKAARPDASVRLLDGLDHHFRGPDGRVSADFLKALVDALESCRNPSR